MIERMGRSAALVLALAGACAWADGWSSWRGPEQTGFARENAAVTKWSLDGENVLWRKDFGGRTTPIVWDGRVFFNAPLGEGASCRERVVCLDADTGKLIWQSEFGVYHTDIVENRVGWSSVVVDEETGNVYCHATGGELLCWDRDGQRLWTRSLTEEFGRISGYGGRLMSPIVDEDRVVLSFLCSSWGPYAKGGHRYAAFDKRSGELIWWAEPGGVPADTTYATPVVAVIGGKRMLIAPNADGAVYALLSRTGETVWQYRLNLRGLNTSPVVEGDRVYVTQSEENLKGTLLGTLVCIDGTKSGDITDSGTIWRHEGEGFGYASPALANGRLYCVDNSANLFCYDAIHGTHYWTHNLGRVGKGSPVVTADGVIYVAEQNGAFLILKDQGSNCVTLDADEFPRPDGNLNEIFGSPAVCGGRVYFMSRYDTLCLAPSGAPGAAAAAPRPPMPEELELARNVERCLIVPADVTLAPGESVKFSLRPFYADGRPSDGQDISQAPTFSLAGLKGEISSDGLYTAPPDAAYSAGMVKAQWLGPEVAARVRIVPNLPILETFDAFPENASPPGWISAGIRVGVVTQDGNKVLAKKAPKEQPSPPFMRLRTFVTPVLEAGYTVQCDLMSLEKEVGRRRLLPDMGLVNARYQLTMLGADKGSGGKTQLRIEAWGTLPRIRHDVEFDWNANTWYTVRFDVRLTDDGKAVCRGKVWPRGQSEPGAWTIETTDAYPYREGAAGLYAYSTGTTPKSDGPMTYFDNLKVYRDE